MKPRDYSHPVAAELVGTVYQAISNALVITATTQAQADAITSYCERLNALTGSIDARSQKSFEAEFAEIAEVALMIWEACEAGTVSIAYRRELPQ